MTGDDVLGVRSGVAPVLPTDADGLLRFEGEVAAFNRLDRSYIAAAATAFSKGRDIALIYPSPPTYVQLPVLLAVGYQSREGPPALFVSNRSGIREQYFNLGIGDKFAPPSIEPTPLGDMTAPMVKTGDGQSVSYITNHQPPDWEGDPEQAALVHTNFGKKLAHQCELGISGLVLDFTTGLLDDYSTQRGWEQIAKEKNIPRVMIFDSPSHDYLESLEKENERRRQNDEPEILFWGWSHTELQHAPERLLEPVADHEPAATDGGSPSRSGSASINPFSESVGPLGNIAAGIDRQLIEIPHGELETVAKAAWTRLGETGQVLQEEENVSSFAHDSLASAYFIYSYLDGLLTSVDYHDSLMRLDEDGWGTGKTIQHKINAISSRTDQLDDEIIGVGEQLQDACDELERMTEALRGDNLKADMLVEQLRDAVDTGQTMTVLAPTRKQESIVRSFITERTEFSGDVLSGSGIKFHNLYSPHTVPESDILLFPGVPTGSHYPTLLAGAAPEHRFLVYDWTVDRLRRRLSDVLATAEWRAGGGPQHHLADELGLSRDRLANYTITTKSRGPGPVDYETRRELASEALDDVEVERTSGRQSAGDRIGFSESLAPEDLSIDIDDLSSETDDFWAEEQEFDRSNEQETINEGRGTADASSNEHGEVEALRVEFSDESYLFEQPSGLFWKLDHSGSQLTRTRVSAQALEAGDEVIVIKDDSRRDIFEHIVEKIHSECRGPFQDYLSMLDLWTTGIDQIINQLRPGEKQRKELGIPDDREVPLRRLADWIETDLEVWATENEGDPTRTKIQIQKWLNKETIGPSDPLVIRALGDIYDIESLRSHSQQIFRGLEEIRHLHVRVGHNLSKILLGAQASNADDWLLEECGLRVGDVQDATAVKTVSSKSEDTQAVNTRRIGYLHQP